jgi:L-2-hydroxyglutarate oxidase LhgO
MDDRIADVTVVGGGIVGMATAYRLVRLFPGCRVVVLEKEEQVASHQTAHNSGVIHSGLYYRPGSSKAHTCVTGAAMMKSFCDRHDVDYDVCGKVVVAVDGGELTRLQELHRRGVANGVPGVALIGPERLRELEPHSAGIQALHVPSAGIIDFQAVAAKLAAGLGSSDCEVRTGMRVTGIRHDRDGIILDTQRGPLRTKYMIGCAGLHYARVTRMEGATLDLCIVPFRGEYYQLVPGRRDLVRGLIYPVPDPRFPFLGVHFTRRIDGSVEAGPNAVLALSREGYGKLQVRPRDVADIVGFPGFWRMASKYWRTGLAELTRSLSKSAFAKALARLVPDIEPEDLEPGGAGIRAQALRPNGELEDDFVIVDRPRALHVCNAPSPAATASLSIAMEIVDRAAAHFDLGAAVAYTDPEDWL